MRRITDVDGPFAFRHYKKAGSLGLNNGTTHGYGWVS